MWRMRRSKRKEEKKQLENRIFKRKFVHLNGLFIALVK
jgi:hypothetical protein